MNHRNARVLLAEDDEATREILTIGLTDEGFTVVAVHSGDDAAVKMAEEPFDLLLTDVQMPGQLSGLDLAKTACALDPKLPVIVMTGNTHLVKGLATKQLLLQKPLDFDRLLANIDKLLQH